MLRNLILTVSSKGQEDRCSYDVKKEASVISNSSEPDIKLYSRQKIKKIISTETLGQSGGMSSLQALKRVLTENVRCLVWPEFILEAVSSEDIEQGVINEPR